MAFSSFNSIQSNWSKNKVNVVKPDLMIANWGGATSGVSMKTSYYGQTWNAFGTSPPYYFPFPMENINSFATNGTILVMGGSTLVLMYSVNNGITWTACIKTAALTSCRGVVYNPNSNMFVATGTGTIKCAYSSDGITWTDGNNSSVLFTTGYSVDYIGTNWIVGGSSGAVGYLGYSSDGINWSLIGRPQTSCGIYGVASCRSNASSTVKWVAVGDSKDAVTPTVMYSTDPSGSLASWTAAYMGGVQVYQSIILGSANVASAAYNGSVWIVGGYPAGGYNIATSPDGQNWTQSTTTSSAVIRGIACNGTDIVAVSNGATLNTDTNIIVSIDNGVNWIQRGYGINTPGLGGGICNAVMYYNNSFIIGSERIYRAPGQYQLMSLPGPINSSSIVGLARNQGLSVTGVATNGTAIVVVGNGISTSIDKGITWISIMTVGATALGNILFNTVYWSNGFNKFIASTTANGGIYSSPDGLTWTYITITGIGVVRRMAISDPSLNSAATCTIVLVTGPTNLIYTSTDLSTWNKTSTPIGGVTFGSPMQAVCWAPSLNMFVATGIGTAPNLIVTSSDNGVTWIPRNSASLASPGYSVEWSPYLNIFVAGGNTNQLVYSSDGQTWSNCSPTNIAGAYTADIVWNSSLHKWFATRNTNAMITSTNGINWTTITITPGFTTTAFQSFIKVFPNFPV